MKKVVLVAKKRSVGVAKYLLVQTKTMKIVGKSKTRKGIERIMKRHPVGSYALIENPTVHDVDIASLSARRIANWKKSKEVQANLKKLYKTVLYLK